MTIKVTDLSTPAVVFVRGSNNKLALAVFHGCTRKDWQTAGHINLARS